MSNKAYQPNDDVLLTKTQAANYLNCSENTIWQLRKKERLKGVLISERKIFFTIAELNEYKVQKAEGKWPCAKRGRKRKMEKATTSSIRLNELHLVLKQRAFNTDDSISGVIRKLVKKDLTEEERIMLGYIPNERLRAGA